ncbi:hypothetical protein H4219_005657 [Mycoemilia scoparia]|uniref:OBG-type G domain-containing protein n=1 Tax=Mycoemilia scoparia TaxID=417184 RepID=A0A9W7ZM26_9FUNG|nr:hypothetical protein H4219_005657 [Mycoemilia scoparia]
MSSGSSFVIACVGKPSAGKSSFLNAVTEANAKVGNFPFTTIEPNQGIAYYPIDCACKRFNKSSQCKPRYGSCKDGKRLIPVRMLDVAGLVPGASEGRGLGNQFLDDLRHADALIHVVDASGGTDENGKETKNYDPINDIEWLRFEIHSWVYNNLLKKWPGIVRRQVATKTSPITVFQENMSGYGANREIIIRCIERMNKAAIELDKEGQDSEMAIPGIIQKGGSSNKTNTSTSLSSSNTVLTNWTKKHLHKFVSIFLDERFPTVVALNKIDRSEADKNIIKILRKYSGSSKTDPLDGIRQENIVVTSALSECFLKKLKDQGYIKYTAGDEDFESHEEDPTLKKADGRTFDRLEEIRDLVLFRYGSTGVQDVIVRAVRALRMIPVFPVKNVTNFTNKSSSGDGSGAAFVDCVLVREGTTVRQVAGMVNSILDKQYAGAETVGGLQLGENDVIVPKKNDVLSFKLNNSSR